MPWELVTQLLNLESRGKIVDLSHISLWLRDSQCVGLSPYAGFTADGQRIRDLTELWCHVRIICEDVLLVIDREMSEVSTWS